MNAAQFQPRPTKALARLDEFLKETKSTMTVTEAAGRAIDAWMAAQRRQSICGLGAAELAPLRGYQWKELFLPDGTELRVEAGDRSCYARVVGEHILYEGRPVSPRQFCLAAAGSGRNAWRDTWVLLASEGTWRPACVLRRRALADTPAAPPRQLSPQEALATAADAMTQALRAALVLVDQLSAAVLDTGTCRFDD